MIELDDIKEHEKEEVKIEEKGEVTENQMIDVPLESVEVQMAASDSDSNDTNDLYAIQNAQLASRLEELEKQVSIK